MHDCRHKQRLDVLALAEDFKDFICYYCVCITWGHENHSGGVRGPLCGLTSLCLRLCELPELNSGHQAYVLASTLPTEPAHWPKKSLEALIS